MRIYITHHPALQDAITGQHKVDARTEIEIPEDDPIIGLIRLALAVDRRTSEPTAHPDPCTSDRGGRNQTLFAAVQDVAALQLRMAAVETQKPIAVSQQTIDHILGRINDTSRRIVALEQMMAPDARALELAEEMERNRQELRKTDELRAITGNPGIVVPDD